MVKYIKTFSLHNKKQMHKILQRSIYDVKLLLLPDNGKYHCEHSTFSGFEQPVRMFA